MLALETENRRAFEAALEGVRAINRFTTAGEYNALQLALDRLHEAMIRDENYLLPRYYIAVVYDLLGQSDEAAAAYAQLLEGTPVRYRKLRREMRLGLAAAQYHGYDEKDLERATQTVRALLDDPRDVSRRQDRRIRGYADALQAQLIGTSMIPPLPEDMASPEGQKELEEKYKKATALAEQILSTYERPLFPLVGGQDKNIAALAHNARALAQMYYTDYKLVVADKIKLLKDALEDLRKDDNLFPGDAAYYCDLASCHLRLGYWTQQDNDVKGGTMRLRSTSSHSAETVRSTASTESDATTAPASVGGRLKPEADYEFRVAETRLNTVIDRLRPGYGFAHFELGRVFRLKRHFERAMENFEKAKLAPDRERDVTIDRIEREIGLVRRLDDSYP